MPIDEIRALVVLIIEGSHEPGEVSRSVVQSLVHAQSDAAIDLLAGLLVSHVSRMPRNMSTPHHHRLAALLEDTDEML